MEVVQQVISVPYDPSSIEYENGPMGDAIQWRKVVQVKGYWDAHQPERSATMISAVPVTDMSGCPKASDSPSREKKGTTSRFRSD